MTIYIRALLRDNHERTHGKKYDTLLRNHYWTIERLSDLKMNNIIKLVNMSWGIIQMRWRHENS
jgi:hypothetical protein